MPTLPKTKARFSLASHVGGVALWGINLQASMSSGATR